MLTGGILVTYSHYFWPMQLYRRILYFISAVILITLAIQVYYNMRGYEGNERRLRWEIQISVDMALDNYFIDLAQKNITSSSKQLMGPEVEVLSENSPVQDSNINKLKSLFHKRFTENRENRSRPSRFLNEKMGDSIHDFAQLTSRIIAAITADSLDLKKLTPYIKNQLESKDIRVPFGYVFENPSGEKQVYNAGMNNAGSYIVYSRSPFLPKKSHFTLYYDQVAPIILRRNLLSISLSAVLIGAVIACLLFLLKVINNQKQLAELKNDLISNITHEFKTPIATIGVALEGIENFNAENDPQKTKNYVRSSTVQLEKLNLMVEKLLETATLDDNELQLNKEEVDLTELLQHLINKHQSLASQKDFSFECFCESATIQADVFYLENALNNILDNAVKYGGNHIKVTLSAEKRDILIKIEDNGAKLTSAQAKQVFEKFYRVPKGNTHDIKGFGIGLYYTKKIIEKHSGNIDVSVSGGTTFTIFLSNG